MNTFLYILSFYLAFQIFGFIGLPFARRIFSSKPVIWVASKFIGLLAFAYVIWLSASLHLLNYQNLTVITAGWLLIAAGCLYLERNFFKDVSVGSGNKKSGRNLSAASKILILEAVTLAVYFGYLYIRSYNGAINGTERFMDMAFLTAAGKTNFFPFIDPWYAGHTINYYYYGSYLMSLLSNLSRVPYSVAYNLALGLIYSQSVLLSFVITHSLTKSKKLSVLAAFLITTAGTVFFAGCVLKASLGTTVGTCSYASSTRLYTPSYIINEIPSYSFTVGDLHAHLLALPFFLFALLLVLNFLRNEKLSLLSGVFLSLCLASSAMINAWDGITLSCVILAALVFKIFKGRKNEFIIFAAGIFALAGLMYYPAARAFHNPVLGLGFIPTYFAKYHLSAVQWPTPILAELGMWGIFMAAIILAIFKNAKSFWRENFAAILLLLSFGIIVGVELFFVRDIYSVANPPYFRANTTFKFGYHAWVILSLLFTFSLGLLWDKNKNNLAYSSLARWLVLVAVLAGAFYPYQAVNQFYFSVTDKNISSLNGSQWLSTNRPGDLATINYIISNFSTRTVIAEAVGDSYTDFARMSVFSGSVSPMGWKTHEWTWRFKAEAAKNIQPGQQVETGWSDIAKVAGDMEVLYTTADISLAKQIIERYKISYVYVGTLERSTYKNLNEQKFSEIGIKIFNSDNSTLYKID